MNNFFSNPAILLDKKLRKYFRQTKMLQRRIKIYGRICKCSLRSNHYSTQLLLKRVVLRVQNVVLFVIYSPLYLESFYTLIVQFCKFSRPKYLTGILLLYYCFPDLSRLLAMLFNLFIDFVIRVYLDKCKNVGIKFLNLKYGIPTSA